MTGPVTSSSLSRVTTTFTVDPLKTQGNTAILPPLSLSPSHYIQYGPTENTRQHCNTAASLSLPLPPHSLWTHWKHKATLQYYRLSLSLPLSLSPSLPLPPHSLWTHWKHKANTAILPPVSLSLPLSPSHYIHCGPTENTREHCNTTAYLSLSPPPTTFCMDPLKTQENTAILPPLPLPLSPSHDIHCGPTENTREHCNTTASLSLSLSLSLPPTTFTVDPLKTQENTAILPPVSLSLSLPLPLHSVWTHWKHKRTLQYYCLYLSLPPTTFTVDPLKTHGNTAILPPLSLSLSLSHYILYGPTENTREHCNTTASLSLSLPPTTFTVDPLKTQGNTAILPPVSLSPSLSPSHYIQYGPTENTREHCNTTASPSLPPTTFSMDPLKTQENTAILLPISLSLSLSHYIQYGPTENTREHCNTTAYLSLSLPLPLHSVWTHWKHKGTLQHYRLFLSLPLQHLYLRSRSKKIATP